MKIVFVQTGDFAEAYARFAKGEPESYRDQKASVDYVASLAGRHEVTTLCVGERPHDKVLAPNLRSIGRNRDALNGLYSRAILDELQPDRLILRSPFLAVARAAEHQQIMTLPCFADLFQKAGLRAWVRHKRLHAALRGAHITCVSNHSVNASRSVVDVLGISADKVVPWDWGRLNPNPEPKVSVRNLNAPALFYAGVLSHPKGVGDCLEALKLMHKQGLKATMSFAGKGDLDQWRGLAAKMGVADAVQFLGVIPNTEVRERMAAHDFVLVPSRHSYPEGLPNTIYEALASRSPLILSDHPAFSGRIEPERGAIVFTAGRPESLAEQISRVASDSSLYAQLSASAPVTLEALYVGLEWSRLVDLFLHDPKNEENWVSRYSLASLI